MRKAFKILLFIFMVFLVAMIAFFTYLVLATRSAKLDKTKLQLQYSTATFFDKDDNKLSAAHSLDKIAVKINQIPEHTINAFIAIEDKRFYKHSGVDYKRLAKAAITNITSFKYQQGASTISQQLIKNTHLTNTKTLKRKFSEIKITKELEKKYSKNQILEFYLNSIYFGENSFGIYNAAQTYFNKTVDQLNIAESAMLAAVIKAPTIYSPFSDANKCEKRRNLVLATMQQQDMLTKCQLEEAKATSLPSHKFTTMQDSYLKCAFQEALQLTNLSPYELASGFTVKTYMDSALQSFIKELEINEIKDFAKSFIAINNTNGGILAYDTNYSNIKRMPGSIIKPLLVYAPAIENNVISPATIIEDEPTDFGGYIPKNYNDIYFGKTSVRQAIKKSLNIPAVKVLNYTGIEKSKRYLEKLNLELDESDTTLTMALGGLKYGIRFNDIVNAYSTFANAGIYKKASFIRQIENANSKIIYKNKQSSKQVFTKETAYLINDILKDTTRDGTARNLKSLDFEVAAKTGTNGNQNGNTDAYTVAYTSQTTTGFWVGAKDNNLMPNSITGGSIPAAALKTVLDNYYKNTKPSNFFECENIIKAHLDLLSYTQDGIIELAEYQDGNKYTFTELFKKDNLPTNKSSRFSNPKIENCSISVKNNSVNIVLCLAEYYEYRLYREQNGKETLVLDSINAKDKKNILDKPLKNGIYSYYLIPYSNVNSLIFGNKVEVGRVKIDSLKNEDADKIIIDKDEWWKE